MKAEKNYKYLDIITVIFVVILLLSNLVASIKITKIGDVSFAAGLIFFPITYLIGDLLTEVYGYSQSRKVIWTGFGSLMAANLIVKTLVLLPPDPHWGLQGAYEQVFNIGFRISLASMIAYFSGEFCNSYVLAKLKVWTKGKMQALRVIGSTVVGEFVDTVIFYPLAFWNTTGFPTELIAKIMITNYVVKVLWEVLAYPVTKQIIKFLKRSESEDYYDYNTDFNPFHLTE